MLFPESHIEIPETRLTVTFTDEGPAGAAPVILFIHGFPFSKSMWDMQVKVLKEEYRVIAYDVRGHGNSKIGPDDFSIELFADDLIRFMDVLEIDSATICGLSMGGYIALRAMEKVSNRFDALVLCDTQCKADTPEGVEKRMKAIDSIQENGREHYAEESVKNLFAPESFTTRKEEIAAIRETIIHTSTESLVRTLRALAGRKETCSKLVEIKVPVLIMVGEKDNITPPAAAWLMHEGIKGSTLKILDHAGHMSNLENPDAFNEHLTKFVASVYKKV